MQRLRGGHSHFPPGQAVTAATNHRGEETSTQCVRRRRGFPSEALLLRSDTFKSRGLTNSRFYILENALRSLLFAPPQGGALFPHALGKKTLEAAGLYVCYFSMRLNKVESKSQIVH